MVPIAAPSRKTRLWRRLALIAILIACIGVPALGGFLWAANRTPREWAVYLPRLADRHNSVITGASGLVTKWLIYADRLAVPQVPQLPPSLGASPSRSGAMPPGHVVAASSIDDLKRAVDQAEAGDVIVLTPGHYRIEGPAIALNAAGTADDPITLRAQRLGDVVIEANATIAFQVMAPFWHIENLIIEGTCVDHRDCEHAFHVTGQATDLVIRNNRLEDFNAHIKINGVNNLFPDRGTIEGNTLTNLVPRDTTNPITPIDVVAANGWRIAGNIITDFVRTTPDRPTYGAFVKGAGQDNVMERNVIICEWKLHAVTGQHVGLSLGGGGSDPALARDEGRSGLEQLGGIIRDNLIAGCSDDGIYLDRAARSVIDHNTLLDTAGIDGRFLETSATVTSNIVDGVIRGRDDARVQGWDNASAWVLGLFAGWHPQRGYFRDPAALDLTWRNQPAAQTDPAPRPDLCGRMRDTDSPPGAFADYAACLLGQ